MEFYLRKVELQELEKRKKIHIAALKVVVCPCYYQQQMLLYVSFFLFMGIVCPSFAWSTDVS